MLNDINVINAKKKCSYKYRNAMHCISIHATAYTVVNIYTFLLEAICTG